MLASQNLKHWRREFGRAVRAMNRGQPCVLKIGMDSFVSDVVDDSLHRECEIMVNNKQESQEYKYLLNFCTCSMAIQHLLRLI